MTGEDTKRKAALALGAAGAIPFLAGAIALTTGMSLPFFPSGGARGSLVVYAAAILSFLGGVRWGIAMGYDEPAKAVRDFCVAVVPALIAWFAATLLSAPADLWVLAAAFLALGLMDYGLTCREVAPLWYGRLRLALSALVAAALAVAAIAAPVTAPPASPPAATGSSPAPR